MDTLLRLSFETARPESGEVILVWRHGEGVKINRPDVAVFHITDNYVFVRVVSLTIPAGVMVDGGLFRVGVNVRDWEWFPIPGQPRVILS